MLLDYLKENYTVNEPILISDIHIDGLSDSALRQQLKRLTDDEILLRYDTGVYYFPTDTSWGEKSTLLPIQVIDAKYMKGKGERCGYISGINFANQIGLTTQVPLSYEIATNKASTEYREVKIAKTRVILRKPRTPITESNYQTLQLLDLIKDSDVICEAEGKQLCDRVQAYMKAISLQFNDMKPYLDYYPDKIYKNLYETGVLNNVST